MQPRIAIVGAGIAGLSAALAFAHRNCHVDILERQDSLEEVGAGLQLSPNATHLLNKIGVLESLSQLWHEPAFLRLNSGKSLRQLARVPVGQYARDRWNWPYVVVHRADLQNVLTSAVNASIACQLHLGKPIGANSEQELLANLTHELGHEPDFVICADGVWSQLRGLAPQSTAATFSGSTAWRATLAAKDFPSLGEPGNVNVFFGAKTHLVSYPLGHRKDINMVAVTPGNAMAKNWDQSGDVDTLIDQFKGWNKGILSALGAAQWKRWPLFEVRNDQWRIGEKSILIGDAAHAMTPHAAQGAAMSIEDALCLATCFTASNGDLPTTMARYETLRKPRIDRVRKRGDFNKYSYHVRGPARIARDAVLAFRRQQTLAAGLDWIHNHRADQLPE